MRLSSVTALVVLAACDPPVNYLPTVYANQELHEQTYTLGEAIEIVVQASDEDGGSLHVVIQSNLEGETKVGEAELPADGTPQPVPITLSQAGNHQLTIQAIDAGGDVATYTIEIEVNGPPVLPEIVITPESPTSGEVLVGSIVPPLPDFRDPDGDNVLYELFWKNSVTGASVNGAPLALEVRIQPSSLVAGHEWVFHVAAIEVDEFNIPLEGGLRVSGEATVVIGNSAPTMPTVSIDPSSPNPANDLLCLAEGAVDADLDTITYTYAWKRSGVVQSAYTASVLPSSATAETEGWSCEATPSDGDATGPTGASGSVTISSGTLKAGLLPRVLQGDPTGPDPFTVGPTAAGLDMDGLGREDLVLGFPDAGSALEGELRFYASGTFIDGASSQHAARIVGRPGMRLGASVQRIPDVQGLGMPDLLVSAPGDGVAEPAVMIVSGGTVISGDWTDPWAPGGTGPKVILLEHDKALESAGFGAAIAGGNLYKEAETTPRADVAITQAADAPTVWVFPASVITRSSTFNPPTWTTGAARQLLADPGDSDFGASLAVGGEFGTGGHGVLLVGSRGEGTNRRVAHLFAGESFATSQSFGADQARSFFTEEQVDAEAGHRVAIVPDLDGDGRDELLVTAPAKNDAGSAVGTASIFFGAATWKSSYALKDANVRLLGTAVGGRFGDEVQVLDDLGWDGLAEIAIAAPLARTADAKSEGGVVYVFSGDALAAGGTFKTTAARLQIGGEGEGHHLTLATGRAGDLTHDGVEDLLLVAPGWKSSSSSPEAGRLYTWFSME